jgi:hypothetical protein
VKTGVLKFKAMEHGIDLSGRATQYYALSRQWESDLEFFRIETAFLHRLLDDYFVRLLAPAHIEQLKEAGRNLYKLETDEGKLNKLVDDQLKKLSLISEAIIPEDQEELGLKHRQLEQSVSKLTTEYREVKKQLFELVEKVMSENKLIAK